MGSQQSCLGLNRNLCGVSLFCLSRERGISSMSPLCPHSVPTRAWELAMGSLCPQGTGYHTCKGELSSLATLGESSSASPSSSFSSSALPKWVCCTQECYTRAKPSSPSTARYICAALSESVFCQGNSSTDPHLPSKRAAHR